MKKWIFLAASLLLWVGSVKAQAQAATDIPPGFKYASALLQPAKSCQVSLPVSAEDLEAEDLDMIKDGFPLRVALNVPVDVELTEMPSEWTVLPDGSRVWRQVIDAPGAGGVILLFDELYLPDGAVLYVYDTDCKQVHRITHADNPDGGIYSLPRLIGEGVVMEYVPPANDTGMSPRIKLSEVGYIYRNLQTRSTETNCFINTTCEEGDNWQEQAKGVVLLDILLYSGGVGSWYVCTGSLINNVRQDGTPYLLTASHCFDGYSDATLNRLGVYFFLDAPESATSCVAELYYNDFYQTLTGAELLSYLPLYGGSDGTLLKLNDTIPSDWDVYFNGWDAQETIPSSGVSIHHPNGMVKKISTYTTAPTTTTWYDLFDRGTENAHWEVTWVSTTNGWSVTYGGSSGAPLFNEDGLIVGTLSGGTSYCPFPTGVDYYGKFSYHWDNYSDTLQHFSRYLDPDNTGTRVLGGYAWKSSDDAAGNASLTNNTGIYITDGGILICRNNDSALPVDVYELTGRKVWSGTMNSKEMLLPKNLFGKGMYCVKVGHDTHKILVP